MFSPAEFVQNSLCDIHRPPRADLGSLVDAAEDQTAKADHCINPLAISNNLSGSKAHEPTPELGKK